MAIIQVKCITKQFCEKAITRIVQNESKSNTWRKRTKDDGKIDWRMSSDNIYNLIRALTKPYPGAHFVYKDREYKVWSSEIIENNKYENIEYGKIIKVNNDKTFIIKTGDGVIKIKQHECDNLKEGEYLI